MASPSFIWAPSLHRGVERMDRTLQRSLVGSSVAHAALLLIVLMVGGLAAKKVIAPDVPVLEIIPTDMRLTMGEQIGGGTPTPLPVASQERPGPPPAAPVLAPVSPPPQVQPQTPVVPPAPPVQPTAKPAPKVATPKVPVAKDPPPAAKAQDVDVTRLVDKKIKVSTAPAVQVSSAKRKRADDDQRAAAEAAEAASASARARDQRLASARSLANRLSGAVTGVSKNTGTSTKIEMVGPGGAAYGPYYSYLKAFLKQQWRKPATSSEREAMAEVELSISRDGTVLSAEVTRRSGVAALDASVEELFRRHRKLRPLPEEYDRDKMVVPVRFVLESSLSQ